MMETNTKASNKCSKPHCRNDAASRRAKFCTDCFRTNASCANSKRKVFGGNTTTARGKGVLGNKGNTRAKGVLGNKGNTTTGEKKKKAGKRSALRRSAKMLGEVPVASRNPLTSRIAMAMKAMTRPMTAAKTAKVQTAMKVVKKLVAMKAAKASTPKAMKVVKKFVAMKTAKAAATPKAPVKKKPAALATKAIVDTLLFIRSVDGRMHYVGMGGYFD